MKAIIVMIVNRCLRRLGLIAIASCLPIAGAKGQVVVYSSLTTPNNTGLEIIGGSVPTSAPTIWANSFTVIGDFTLLDAKVSIITAAGDPTFNVFLAKGDGSPDVFIHWRQIGFNLRAPSVGGVVTVNSTATPIALTSGTTYWLVLAPANPHSHIMWNLSGCLFGL
jgi:hypothetical protein